MKKKIVSIMLTLGMAAAMMTQCVSAQEAESSATAIPGNVYMICVQDADSGKSVEDVVIQFCNDTSCTMGETDEDGNAVFEADAGNYTVHVLEVPEGYEMTDEERMLTADERTGIYYLSRSGEEEPEKNIEDEEWDYRKTDDEWVFPYTGFTLKLPDCFKNCVGQISAEDRGQDQDPGIVRALFAYYPRTDEEYRQYEDYCKTLTIESNEDAIEWQKVWIQYAAGAQALFEVIGIQHDMSMDDLLIISEIKQIIDLGETDHYKYYLVVNPYYTEEDREEMTDALFDEYESLLAQAEDIAENITVREPKEREKEDLEDIDVIGTKVSFETTDLNGNPVRSEDLFASHKVTMINIWATWCGPCCGELPELEKLSAEIAGEECQIIGICDDTIDGEDVIAEAKNLLSEYGVTYMNLVQKEEIQELLPLPAYPITYFVDSEGTILTKPVVGAHFDKYQSRLEEALNAVGESK